MNNTKAILLKTAARLFAQKGYHATGIAEILKKSGAPKGSLYYHFPGGKEELAKNALEDSIREILRQLKSNLAAAEEPMEAVAIHLEYLAKRVAKDNFEGDISITLMTLENLTHSSVLLALCKEFYADVQRLYKEKFISADYGENEAEDLALLVVNAVEGAITLALAEQNPEVLRRTARCLLSYVK